MFGRNRRYSETPKHWTFWDHNFTVIKRLSTLRGKIVLPWSCRDHRTCPS